MAFRIGRPAWLAPGNGLLLSFDNSGAMPTKIVAQRGICY